MAASLQRVTSPPSASLPVRPPCSCTRFLESPCCIAIASPRHSQLLHKQLFCHTSLARKSSSHHDAHCWHPRPFGRFSVKSMEVSGPGSIDSGLIASMHAKLKEYLKAEEVIVKDAYGDGRHVSIDVVSSEFEGKSSVNRQRMVYKAIWEELQTSVHAVDNMRTRTPAEAAQEK